MINLKLDNQKTALTLGTFAALAHLVWVVVVALGMASAWLDFVYGLHFLNNPFTVAPFSVTNAVMLLVVAFVMGSVVGWVFAYVWNWLHKK